jgi:hypothetical protein
MKVERFKPAPGHPLVRTMELSRGLFTLEVSDGEVGLTIKFDSKSEYHDFINGMTSVIMDDAIVEVKNVEVVKRKD